MLNSDQFNLIGQVLKSNGSDGQLVISLCNYAGDLRFVEPVYILFDGLPVPYFVDVVSERGANRIVAYLTDVCSQKDAEELAGRKLYMESADEDDEDGIDFTGWTLFNRSVQIGIITGAEDIPGNPCLEVELESAESKQPARRTLIPLHEDFILEADATNRILKMSLPEGLLSL